MENTQRPMERAAHFLGKYFLALLIGSYLAAAFAPGPGLWIRGLTLGQVGIGSIRTEASVPFLMLACLLFNAGLAVETSRLGGFLRHPRPLVAGLSANIFFPILYIIVMAGWMTHWSNTDEAQCILVGLALVASMPIAGSSTAWSQNADGDMTLSLALVLGSTFLSPLVTPMALHTVGFVTTGDYSEDLHELAGGHTESFLAIGVLVPSLLGIAVGRMFGRNRVVAARPALKVWNSAILIVLNYSNASISLPKVIAHPDYDFLGLIVAIVSTLCILAFAVGWGIARMLGVGRDRQVALMFALGMNNNGTGLVLASMALADHPQVMLPIIFYTLVQHLVAGGANALIGRRPDPSDGGPSPIEVRRPTKVGSPHAAAGPREPALRPA